MLAKAEDILAMVCLAKVVQTGSFTAAGQALDLSKSTVSARIAQLERRLGFRVLHRTTRSVTVTEDGLRIFEQCQQMLSAAEEAAQLAVHESGPPRGVLRVNAPRAFSELLLAEPLTAFLSSHPELRLNLSLEDRFVDLVAERVDVAIRITERLRDSTLRMRRLGSFRWIFCASPAYLRARGTPHHPQDLLHHNCLRYGLVPAAHEWRLVSATGEEAVLPVSGDAVVDDGAMLRRLALAGLGIVALPGFMVARDLEQGALLPVLPEAQQRLLSVYVVHPHGDLVSPKVRAFVDHLVAWFQTARWDGPHVR